MILEFDNTAVAFEYKSDRELKKAHLLFSLIESPWITRAGSALTLQAIRWKLPITGIIKNTIFRQFCGGETLEEAALTADVLGKYGVGAILDYGVEGKATEEDFDRAVPEFIKAIDCAASRKNIPFISLKVTGFASFGLLEKKHSGAELSDEEKAAWQRVINRISTICEAAFQKQIKVLIDAEETWIQEGINELSDEMMMRFNRKTAIVYNTFQMYCHGTLPWLYAEIEKASTRGYILGAKLVRGAYMEKERKRAQEMGYPSPIQPNKEATDNDYNTGVAHCLQNLDKLALFIGTHNEKSCILAIQKMKELGIHNQHPHVFFSQLYGMSDNISFNLAHHQYNIAKYLPYGPVKDVVPYLLRRAEENTSVAGQTGRELSLLKKEIMRRKGL